MYVSDSQGGQLGPPDPAVSQSGLQGTSAPEKVNTASILTVINQSMEPTSAEENNSKMLSNAGWALTCPTALTEHKHCLQAQ